MMELDLVGSGSDTSGVEKVFEAMKEKLNGWGRAFGAVHESRSQQTINPIHQNGGNKNGYNNR
jgi:hypothetical protein